MIKRIVDWHRGHHFCFDCYISIRTIEVSLYHVSVTFHCFSLLECLFFSDYVIWINLWSKQKEIERVVANTACLLCVILCVMCFPKTSERQSIPSQLKIENGKWTEETISTCVSHFYIGVQNESTFGSIKCRQTMKIN